MYGITTLATLLAAVSTVSAFPKFVKRQANGGTIAIKGAADGGVNWRKDINSLQQDADTWNIYLLALQKFQSMDSSDPMSWFQIAGIHGQPYVTWDGVDQCSNCTLFGYCTHSSTLFPTWHRGYMALFEQSLTANAMAAANEFSGDDQTKYVAAATALRAPYWDWAQPIPDGDSPFPNIFTADTVSVVTPSGQQDIPNPLLQYSFNGDTSGMNVQSTTQRNPTFTTQSRQGLRDQLWQALSSQETYNAFSTEALINGGTNNQASLEAVHDQVHVQTGGDMTNPDVAAFDPVFWLHHAMVDHVLELYIQAWPSSWLEPWSEVGHTMTYATGTMEDAGSALAPFHSSTVGDFWTSDSVKDTNNFNYVYDDLASGSSAIDIINNLYRDSDETALSKRGLVERGLGQFINKGIDFLQQNVLNEYTANIVADSMGTEGSFTVFVFDGDFDDSNPAGWYDEENMIGSHGFFTNRNAMGDGSALVGAGISLTKPLLEAVVKGKLKTMSNDDVTAYLKETIQWRVVKAADGTKMDASKVPGLEVAIMTSDVDLPRGAGQLPTWSAFRPLTEITQDKTCGYSGGRWN